jgi:HAE1 family hydrophobic/amphiphilic exporter-1
VILTRWALERPVTVLMLVASLVILGAISIVKLPLEFLPHVEFPAIWVYVPYHDAVPAQVERDIARPIEEAMATLGNVKEIESYSSSEECWVEIDFEWGREIDMQRFEVKQKLDQIRNDLPDDIRDVFIFSFSSNDIPIVNGRISSRGRDLSASYDLIDKRILNPLKRIPGVARVELDGVRPDEVAIYLHLDRIKEHKVDVQALFQRLAGANVNVTVGRATRDGLRYTMRTVGEMRSIDELREMLIDPSGLRLGDIATVIHDVPSQTYGRFIDGEPAVAFWVNKESNANVVEVTRAIEAELERTKRDPALEGLEVLLFFNQGEHITESITSLLQSGLIGSLLAVLVLFFFLRRVRTTLVVSLAIPCSIIATACFLYLTGHSLNVLSMMGLMLAVGMLVDNAIVVLESIHRHQTRGEAPRVAALVGTQEVGRAVVASTLTSVCVFAPIVISPRDEILVWLSETGITISVTLVFSLLISLTLVPLMASRMVRHGRDVREQRLVARASALYERILRYTAVRHPVRTAFLFVPLAIVVTIVIGKLTGFEIDPMSDRGIRREGLMVSYEFTDNMNYRATREVVARVDSVLSASREELGIETLYSYYRDNGGQTYVIFGDAPLSESRVREVRKALREHLPELAGVELRLDGEEEAGIGAKRLEVSLFGEDTEELERLAEEVKRRLELMGVFEDLNTSIEGGKEEVAVSLRRDQASRIGLTPDALGQILGLTFRGVPLPSFKTPQREVDVTVVLEPSDRRSIENLESLTVDYEDGREVTLAQVADLTMQRGPQAIERQDQKTTVEVYGSYEGEQFGKVMEDVRRIMDGLSMPLGYAWSFGGAIREGQRQQNEMAVNILLALACVYFVMASLFESLLHPLVIMLTIPFAFLGVVWTMIVSNTPMNLMALIGVVILCGVVVNNGIVLIDHVNGFRRRGLSRADAIIAGGRERFRPIVMTAATTVLGLIPLAVGDSAMGDIQYYPMARAVMGGLITSTVLTLVLLPTFYVVAEKAAWRLGRAARGAWRGVTWFLPEGGGEAVGRRGRVRGGVG